MGGASLSFYPIQGINTEVTSIDGHALMDYKNLCLLNQLAKNLSTIIDMNFLGKKQVLVCLGQSPAYLLKMLEMMDQKQGGRPDRKYLYAAFSGNFYTLNQNEKRIIDRYIYHEFQELAPYYRNYLKKIGLAPEDLNKDDTEFIIIEVCHYCNGLISFLDFFSHYPKKPSVIYFQSSYFNPVSPFAKSHRIDITASENDLLIKLANTDKFKDRIVPQFQFHRWKSFDPTEFQPEENVRIILHQLENFIKLLVENKKDFLSQLKAKL